MLFVGTHDHTIDAKQRLAVPSGIRQRLERVGQSELLYAVVQDGVLCLYTEAGFERRAEQLEQSDWPIEQLLEYEELFFSEAERLELDAQGRIRLPERMIHEAKLGKEVTVIGVKDHLQVHDRTAWNERKRRIKSTQAHMLVNPRRAMHGGRPAGADRKSQE